MSNILDGIQTTELVNYSITSIQPSLSDLYILFYRTGMNPRPLEMHFHFPEGHDDFRKVVERAKRFCDTCGYKFTKVEKFLTNLEEAERKAMMNG